MRGSEGMSVIINFYIIKDHMKKGVDYIGVATWAMIFNQEGLVLMSQRGPQSRNEIGKWEFPGGSVEFWERCEDALIREIKEEFDIDIEIVELLTVVNHIIPDEHQHWVAPAFVAKHIARTPKIMEPHKCSAIKWSTIEKIEISELSLASVSNYEKYIEKYDLHRIV